MTEPIPTPAQRPVQTPPPSGSGPSGLPSTLQAMEHGRSDNVDLVKALFLGAVLTAFFYEIFPIPFLDQGRVLALFDNQVSEAIVGMTFWSLFLLLFKYLRHRVQGKARQSFLHPRVRALLGQPIYARDVDRIVGQLKETMSTLRVKHFERSIIYRRVVRVLHFVRTAPKKEGVNDLLDYQAQIDLKRLETSYAIVQVFIWAIPILGFIGTVMGIGSSVGEFAGFIQTAESGAQFGAQMRGALSGVTSGLAVAFNTTFLALVLVIPVMMLTSFLQKTEEEFLLGIEEYCLEELQPHLRVNPGEDALAEGYEEHLHRILRLSDTWLGQFEPLVERLSRQTELISAQMAGLPPLVKDFTDRLLTREEDPPPAGRLASRAAEPPTSTGAELPIGEEERQQDS